MNSDRMIVEQGLNYLINQWIPPSLIVNGRGEVLFQQGDLTQFLSVEWLDSFKKSTSEHVTIQREVLPKVLLDSIRSAVLDAFEKVKDLHTAVKVRVPSSARYVNTRVGSSQEGGVIVVVISPHRLELQQDAFYTISFESVREQDEPIARKDEFVAMLAHELRNPLASILSSARLLRSPRMNNADKQEWCLSALERNTWHLSRLVDNLVDVSRITRGKVTLQRKVLPLGPLVHNVVEGLKGVFVEREQDLRLSKSLQIIDRPNVGNLVLETPAPQDSIVPLAALDATRFEKLFLNLLANASKFTPRKGKIEISLASNEETVEVSVKDTGLGIPLDKQAYIFEMFTQLHPGLHRGAGGLGIGLPLAKALAELHEGSIEVRSEGLNQGSEFIIRIPLVKTVSRNQFEPIVQNGNSEAGDIGSQVKYS